jgi:peroxiredoxin
MRRTIVATTLAAVVALLVPGAMTPAAALNVGDKAPDFSLPASTSDDALKPLALSDVLAKGKNVVLFGFVGAWTPT